MLIKEFWKFGDMKKGKYENATKQKTKKSVFRETEEKW